AAHLQLLLVPCDVPVTVQLPTYLRVRADQLEAEPEVQRDRRLVRQRDPCVRAMNVFAFDRLEQLRIKRAPNTTAGELRIAIRARLDTRRVRSARAERAARRETLHQPLIFGNQ